MPTVCVLHRGRWFDLDKVRARKIATNAWELSIPRDEALHRRLRRVATPEAWDGAVFLIDDTETEPAIGSGATQTHLKITALVLG